jgi:TolB protein
MELRPNAFPFPHARPSKEQAFTLIELLVVILISGLLIAIAAASFLGQQEKAKDSEARQQLTIGYKEARAESINSTNQGDWPSVSSLLASMQANEPQLPLLTNPSDPSGGLTDVSSQLPEGKMGVCANSSSSQLELAYHSTSGTVWYLHAAANGQHTTNTTANCGNAGAGSGGGSNASFPNARDLAFSNGTDLIGINADGTSQRTLVSGVSASPSFKADGSKMAYAVAATGPSDPNAGIYVADPDGANPTLIDNISCWTISVSWLGTNRLVYSCQPDPFSSAYLAKVSATGTGDTTLFSGNASASGPISPAGSPDGNTIAFIATGTNGGIGDKELWKMNADGSGLTRLTTAALSSQPGFATSEASPAFSPDSSKLVYTSDRADFSCAFFSGFPVGTWRCSGTPQLWTMTVAGGGATQVTSDSLYKFGPTWSPTGNKFAFSAAPVMTQPSLYTANTDGSGMSQVGSVTVSGAVAWKP